MNMKIVITEEQYKKILIESTLKDTLKDLKINTGILFTFGTGIGAFIGPVERLLSGSGFSMDEKDVILLIITSFALIIKDSESVTLLEKVREKGMMSALKGVINFVTNVKDVLNAVAKNLVGVTYSLLDILGFALLLNPTMKIIDEVIKDNSIGIENTEKLLTGAALASTVYALKSVFGKIKNKIKGNVNEDISPSDVAIKNICDSEKFCSAQGQITFGQLKSIVESATNRRLIQHVGEGGFKATLRLLPWFLPQLAIAGFVTSSIRAVNKILRPTLEETENYKTWWGKVVLKSFNLSEGELGLSDPLSRVFFISDGLMTMLNDRYKVKFAKYIAEIASEKPDDESVPEFFVENELRHWLNDKFLLDPPLQPKSVKEVPNENESLNENYVRFTDNNESELIEDLMSMGLDRETAINELGEIVSLYERLPNTLTLYRLIFSNSEEEIDKQYPGYHYTRKKSDLLENHYFQSYRDSSQGENGYIIKVKIQKQMIDFYESIKNNILYPGEKEITLKDKGFGAKIIEIMPVNN
jgi:hypothetical protein